MMSIFKGKKRTLLILLTTLFVGFCGGVLTQRAGIPRQAKQYVFDKVTETSNRLSYQREWTRYSLSPVLSPTENSWEASLTGWGSILKDQNDYKFYYTGKRTEYDHQIGLANSLDGQNWQKHIANPVLRLGPPGSWDDFYIWCPMVWKEGSIYHMLYSGADTSHVEQIGYAFSKDGFNWTKYENNPIFNDPTWAHNKTEGWGVIKVEGTYYMYYSTLGPSRREIGVATSKDLVSWTAYQDTPIFAAGYGYEYSQFCPWPFKYRDNYYLIVSSNNYLNNSRFKLYESPNPRFLPKERHFLGFILRTHPKIPWEAGGCLDTPCILADDVTMSTFPKGELWMYYTAKEKGDRRHTGLAIQDISKLLDAE